MNYLIDAQLPKRLSLFMQDLGYDTIHTLDLTDKNNTKDSDVNIISLNQQRVVVSKDSDFVDSLLISEKTYKLLHIATGNISNNNLLKIFEHNINKIDELFKIHQYIELTPETIIIHQ